MALKVPRDLQREWEKKLRAEGLAPLTTWSDGARTHRRLVAKLAAATSGEVATKRRYYEKAQKFLRRIELAHAIWALHCEGRGRRDIAVFMHVPEKVVRVVLERLLEISGL